MATYSSRWGFLPASLKADLVELIGNTIRTHSRAAKAATVFPRCGKVSSHVHSRYHRRHTDLPAHGRKVELVLLVCRFRCYALRFPAKNFAERIPSELTWPHTWRPSRL